MFSLYTLHCTVYSHTQAVNGIFIVSILQYRTYHRYDVDRCKHANIAQTHTHTHTRTHGEIDTKEV